MQILVGRYRCRGLVTSPSPKVRPTARRLREALFEILAEQIKGVRFLDLCAGSGVVGLEALSRGASHLTLVERSARFASMIRINLGRCRVPKREADLFAEDAAQFLARAGKHNKQWDIVFFDPPYESDYQPILDLLLEGCLISEDGVLIVEHQAEKPLAETLGRFNIWQRVTEGESTLSFYLPEVEEQE
jgi:16S rRNA (guanine(966)-N(2))-methyltransferase RsmD